MNAPTVSVVIPTYNRAALVCETIDSVLRQTRPADEIIVIDDGSTDDTAAALARFGSHISYVRQDNRGVNPARNAGIRRARGDYIALLDSDDLWEPYKLDLEARLLARFPAAGCVFSDFWIQRDDAPAETRVRGCGLRSWHDSTHDWNDLFRSRQRFSALGLDVPGLSRDFDVFTGDVYERSLHEPMVLPSTALLRSPLARAHPFPEDSETCGDWEFFALFTRQHGALFLDLETTFNRSHEDAVRLTRIDQPRRLERRIRMIDRIWRADREFFAHHATTIDTVQRQLLLRLARMQLFASQPRAARAALARAAALAAIDRHSSERLMNVLAHVPGAGVLLRTLKASAALLRRPASKSQ